MRPPPGFASLLASKFHRWHKSASSTTFVGYLKTELEGADRTWLKKGNLRESFFEAGIDPDVHLHSRLNRDDVKLHLRQIITEIADIVGAEELHDSGMHCPDRIPLPPSLRCGGTYPLSKQYGEKPVITKQALQRKLVAATGKAWAKVLDQTGFSRSNRRIASRTFRQTVQLFVDLQRRLGRPPTRASLRQEERVIFKSAWNLASRMNAAGVPTSLRQELQKDPIFALWAVASAFVDRSFSEGSRSSQPCFPLPSRRCTIARLRILRTRADPPRGVAEVSSRRARPRADIWPAAPLAPYGAMFADGHQKGRVGGPERRDSVVHAFLSGMMLV